MLLFFAPYLAFQKRILRKLGTFRSLHNQLREKVNDLMVQNDILTKNVDRLDDAVTELEQVEKDLAKVAKTRDLDRLVYVVSENKAINEKLKVIYAQIDLNFRQLYTANFSNSSLLTLFLAQNLEKSPSSNCSTAYNHGFKN